MKNTIIILLMGFLAISPALAQQSEYYYYYNGNRIDLEVYINRDVELENIVMEPESFVEIYKDNRVVFKRNVLIKKGAEFIIYKEPYVE